MFGMTEQLEGTQTAGSLSDSVTRPWQTEIPSDFAAVYDLRSKLNLNLVLPVQQCIGTNTFFIFL